MKLRMPAKFLLFAITLLFTTFAAQKPRYKETETTLKFMNGYLELNNMWLKKQKQADQDKWLKNSPLVTNNFLKTYYRILKQCGDPCDWDPIINGNDCDDAYVLDWYDPKSGFLRLHGKEIKDYKIVMRLKKQNGKWLVEGSGAVNIPEKMQIK